MNLFQVLTEGKKATEGVVVRNIKTFLEKQFKRNIANKQFAKRLDTAIQAGISQGQFIKTSPKGRALSVTLNLHFDPDDSRGETIQCVQPSHIFFAPVCLCVKRLSGVS